MMGWNTFFPKVTPLPEHREAYLFVSYVVRHPEGSPQVLVYLRWIPALGLFARWRHAIGSSVASGALAAFSSRRDSGRHRPPSVGRSTEGTLQRPNPVPKRTKAGRLVAFNVHPGRYVVCPTGLFRTHSLPALQGQGLRPARVNGVC